MTGRRRNLVLAAAVGYRWPALAPFVRSLRRSGCDAEVAMLVGTLDAETRARLREAGVQTVPVQRVVSRLPARFARKRFNRHWLGWLHRRVARGAEAQRFFGAACRAGSWFHHIACARYFHYWRFLAARRREYAHVLLSDVRDVVFQRDPFADPHAAGLLVFLEHDAVLGNEPGNDLWVRTGFGEDGLSQVSGRRVSCSGVTLGDTVPMLAYLETMSRELLRRTPRLAGYDGVDQGVHNWLLWTGRLPAAIPTENHCGPVLTMHGMPADNCTVTDGVLRDARRHVVPILHQYDRHPQLAAQLAACAP